MWNLRSIPSDFAEYEYHPPPYSVPSMGEHGWHVASVTSNSTRRLYIDLCDSCSDAANNHEPSERDFLSIDLLH
ncbi:hypothetical protein A0H81_07683 [Grifola frondosa]|uniref:Uncharacterized protein n=1 Tax=Grifola frondosa TaxID=5627 RepID=A0A1C7M719_GRIFR|nr:hypothetical protein A0H81_07683 [Grifola frondosa]